MQEFLTGVRAELEPERVVRTVLFTDIVGSTEHATRLGDRHWRDLLEAHHAIVRRNLERFGGVEVDTAGDGFFAVFDGPARAIRCAGAVRDEVRGIGIEIRAGIHAGEVEIRGGSVVGLAVHIGARVATTADAGGGGRLEHGSRSRGGLAVRVRSAGRAGAEGGARHVEALHRRDLKRCPRPRRRLSPTAGAYAPQT